MLGSNSLAWEALVGGRSHSDTPVGLMVWRTTDKQLGRQRIQVDLARAVR
jgi:hypothetical protein